MEYNIFDLITKVNSYSKEQRLIRIIEIEMRQVKSTLDMMELVLIQKIRVDNGEIKEILKNREKNNK